MSAGLNPFACMLGIVPISPVYPCSRIVATSDESAFFPSTRFRDVWDRRTDTGKAGPDLFLIESARGVVADRTFLLEKRLARARYAPAMGKLESAARCRKLVWLCCFANQASKSDLRVTTWTLPHISE